MIALRKIKYAHWREDRSAKRRHRLEQSAPPLWVVSRDGVRIDAFLNKSNAERLIRSMKRAGESDAQA